MHTTSALPKALALAMSLLTSDDVAAGPYAEECLTLIWEGAQAVRHHKGIRQDSYRV